MNMRPGAKAETLTIRFPLEIKERIVARAIREKRTFSSESEYLIEIALDLLEGSGQAKETRKGMEALRGAK